MQRRIFKITAVSVLLAGLLSLSALAQGRWEEKADGWYYTEEVVQADGTVSTEEAYTGWARYQDEDSWYYILNGKMCTGWIMDEGRFYYLDSSGRMLKDQWQGAFYLGPDGAVLTDTTTPDGVKVNEYGSRFRKGQPVEALNEKTALYVEVYKKHPDCIAEFTTPSTGTGAQIVRENTNGFNWVCFKALVLYDRETGQKLYEGDGAFRVNAVLEKKDSDGNTKILQPMGLIGEGMYLKGEQIFMDPAGFITCVLA